MTQKVHLHCALYMHGLKFKNFLNRSANLHPFTSDRMYCMSQYPRSSPKLFVQEEAHLNMVGARFLDNTKFKKRRHFDQYIGYPYMISQIPGKIVWYPLL